MKKTILSLSLLAVMAFSFSSCKKDNEEVMPETLYERLGGVGAISAVVDEFLTVVVGDNRINSFFTETISSPERVRLLRNNLIDQIGEAAGGPLTYKGLSMEEAHRGMNITDAQFNALVEDLVVALDKFMVPNQEKTELLTVLGGLRPQIVNR